MMQNGNEIWMKDEIDEFSSGFVKKWTSEQAVISTTEVNENYCMYLTEDGHINRRNIKTSCSDTPI